MHTFTVAEDRYGWAIHKGLGMTTTFRTRPRAIQEAERLCDALRAHGECAEVVIEDTGLVEMSTTARC